MSDSLTKSQKQALVWLYERGGSASRQKDTTYLAQGEIAPFMAGTWKRLKAFGLVTHGVSRRLELMPGGKAIAQSIQATTPKPSPTEHDLDLYGETIND